MFFLMQGIYTSTSIGFEWNETNASNRKFLSNDGGAICTCFTPAAGCSRLTDTDDPPHAVCDTLSSIEAVAARILLHRNTTRLRGQV